MTAGNVRELENAIGRAVTLTDGPALRVLTSEFRGRAVYRRYHAQGDGA